MKRGGLILVLVLYCFSSFSQQISAEYHNKPLSEVLIDLSIRYALKFAYDNQATDTILVNSVLESSSVEQFLSGVLQNTGLIYEKRNEVYVIIPSGIPGKGAAFLRYRKITGIVKDKHSGEHLPYATITLAGTQNGTLANSDGYFTFVTTITDTISLKIRFIGYHDEIVDVLPMVKPELITIEMSIKTQEMPQVVITREAQQLFEMNKEAGSITLNPVKLIDIPAIAEQDIVTPLQLMPGIDATTETSSGLNIRKSPSDKNMILYDGFTIYQIDHFFGMISSFNSKAIKDIQVYKSGFDAKYGGRASSVIEITGKSGNKTKPSFDIGADLWSIDGMAEIPIKDKASFVFTGRRSYTDVYQSPLFRTLFEKTRYDLQNYYNPQAYLTAFKSNDAMPSLFFYDATAKITYKPTAKDVISISSYLGSDHMSFLRQEKLPYIKETTTWSNKGISFRWARKHTERYYHNLVIGASDYKGVISHLDTNRQARLDLLSYFFSSNRYELQNGIRDISFNFNNQFQVNRYSQLEFGLASNFYQTNLYYQTETKGDSSYVNKVISINKNSQLHAAYMQGIFSYGKLTSLKIGLRGNYYSMTEKFNLEPRISALYSVTPNFHLKMTAGNYFQYVNRLMNQTDFRNLWVMADNKEYPVVKCNHLMVGGNYDFSSTFSIDVEFYYKRTNGLPIDSVIYIKSAGEDSLYKISTEHVFKYVIQNVYGMDILLKKSFGNYQAWIAYTLSKTECIGQNINYGYHFRSPDDQRHEFKIFNMMKYRGWNFSLSWILGSGKPWTFYNLDYELQYKTYMINTRQLPLYHRMDLGANYNFKMRSMNMKVGLNIFNVYNHKNMKYSFMKLKDNAAIEAATGGTPLERVDVYGLGFTPNLFVNVRF